ncbi:MAG: transglutaminase domain-containing protein [Alistipes sp.]|nr:transglutaminase domain-containing protein [Alistipes sp.]
MKKNIQKSNGIAVCDSIVMSVKNRRPNLRKVESCLIAVIGYISTIMVFLTMFRFRYNEAALLFSGILFSVVYILLSLSRRAALPGIIVSLLLGGGIALKFLDSASLGYKYVFNVIYKASYHTDIEYYKFLKRGLESDSVTAFFIVCAWLLAVIVYVFTIYRHQPLLPIVVSFLILEIGFYNGLEVSIFWGMLLIGFLFASLAMSTIDGGEYYGGNAGFVRRDNIFFPKREMRLKVTEKCGLFIIAAVLAIAGISFGILRAAGYKRSDDLNRKRLEIRDAVASFSMEDIASSISDLTAAFGLDLKLEKHKLGNIASMKYKDKTDLEITIDGKIDGAVYLKDYTGSVYDDNEWTSLSGSAYKNNIFDDFYNEKIYPQDFPFRFNKLIFTDDADRILTIDSKLNGNKTYAPYGTDNVGGLKYDEDCGVEPKNKKGEYSYRFSHVDAEAVAQTLYEPSEYYISLDSIGDDEWYDRLFDYGDDNGFLNSQDELVINSEIPFRDIIYGNPALVMTQMLEQKYKDFVYDNYLQLPKTTAMEEVRAEFSNILDHSGDARDAVDKMQVLGALRTQTSEMAAYSLNPGKTPKNRDFVNYFLLENHKGYCTHYATAGVVLARMAGIPARYATGYVIVGDDFSDGNLNSDGSYTIDVKDNRKHAWVEVYLDGYGWVPYEFTAGYSNQSIDTSTTTTSVVTTAPVSTETTAVDENISTTRNSDTQTTGTGRKKSPKQTTAAATNVGGTKTAENAGVDETNSNDGSGFRLPSAVKYGIYTVLLIGAAIGAVLARRKILIILRKKHFSHGNSASRMHHMHRYLEQIFEYAGIKRQDMQLVEYAGYVEKIAGDTYFTAGSFAEFTDTALRAAFSEDPPDKNELEKCIKLTETTAAAIYEKIKKIDKFKMKYISCLF